MNTPWVTRTPDPRIRSPMLYPAELRGQRDFSMTYETYQIAAGHPVVKIDGTSRRTALAS